MSTNQELIIFQISDVKACIWSSYPRPFFYLTDWVHFHQYSINLTFVDWLSMLFGKIRKCNRDEPSIYVFEKNIWGNNNCENKSNKRMHMLTIGRPISS